MYSGNFSVLKKSYSFLAIEKNIACFDYYLQNQNYILPAIFTQSDNLSFFPFSILFKNVCF